MSWSQTTGVFAFRILFEYKLLNLRNALKTRKFSNHTSDFGMADTMISSYDLKTASKKFKFCLSPKVKSLLSLVSCVILCDI